MRIDFKGPNQRPGGETTMTAVVDGGLLYGNAYMFREEIEQHRGHIEESMFIELMLELYRREIKT